MAKSARKKALSRIKSNAKVDNDNGFEFALWCTCMGNGDPEVTQSGFYAAQFPITHKGHGAVICFDLKKNREIRV